MSSERIGLRGDLCLTVVDANSLREVSRIHAKNTITYDGLNSALWLWGQDGINPLDYQMSKIVFGVNDVTALPSDLSLGSALPDPNDAIVLSAANRAVNTTTRKLVITATLSTGQAVGFTLREIGLLLGNGQLFSRRVLAPAIPKTSAVNVNISWAFELSGI